MKTKARVGRSRFQTTIKECCRLLDLLGMPHVRAAGEAEQLCASLNLYGYSDGCLTNDGDFLLYGGKTIFRDFGIDPKDPHIFVYEMEKIKRRLNIARKDMIGIALLLGCDYTEGVPGIVEGFNYCPDNTTNLRANVGRFLRSKPHLKFYSITFHRTIDYPL